MLNRKKLFLLIVTLMVVVAATIAAVYALDIAEPDTGVLSDAIKACDVDGENHPDASYSIDCPFCDGVKLTRCCSQQCAKDDYFNRCLVKTHPSGCNTVQDVYWNAYVCRQCGYFERGSREDDTHVEAYWHTKDATCFDHVYCSLPKLSDLLAPFGEAGEIASVPDLNAIAGVENANEEYDPAVLAGDYCEVHQIFACDIPHNDVP